MSNLLDNFEILHNIGKGSYGEVALVKHKKDKKQYVLKKINLKKASSRERRSAEQEAKLLSKLKHPNIVSYKDSFEKDGYLYIAMQYCEGGDLYNKLKEQRGALLEERQLVEWFVQIAMALQYMHERNILHRDLKTQNIFLTKSKIIKIGDLGIARVLDNSADMATTLIGTPYYMSPELFSNKPYNHKSDVWALGCCVYEMMTLKHAFNAKDMNSLVYKILRGKMPPMPKQYSPDLVSLLRNMLHQDPNKRPTVNRILRDPYIKKNIAVFLEETKQSRRPSTGSRSHLNRPSSAQSVSSSVPSVPVSSNSESSVQAYLGHDTPDSSRSIDSVRPGSDSEKLNASVSNVDVVVTPLEPSKPVVNYERRILMPPSDLHPIIEGQTVVNEKEEDSDQDTIKNTMMENKDVKKNNEHEKPLPVLSSSPPREPSMSKRKKRSILTKHSSKPRPVENPRPLPPPPPKVDGDGLPQRGNNYQDNHISSVDINISSSSSGSREDNGSLGEETPRSLPNMSAREKRRRNNSNAQSCDRPHSARIRLEPVPDSSKSTVITEKELKLYEQQPLHQRHRQLSLADNSSSSEDETLKDSDSQRHRNKQQNRENREMSNFIELLGNTLQLNKDDDRLEDEELKVVKLKGETPRIPKSSSMPSVDTLCNADRLMARIKLLHEDCIKGVGWDILKKAYEILGRIEEDEVEPKLVHLMGKEKFDLYAGKIWQLKFCEDMARIGVPS